MWGQKALFAAMGLACGFVAVPAGADFTLDNDGQRITVLDSGRPVLSYRYAGERLENENGQEIVGPAHFLHPLYGLMGEQVTGDTPSLWAGASGIYWGWANCLADGQILDVWNSEGGRRAFERSRHAYAGMDTAELGIQNVWLQDATGQAKVLETVGIVVHPTDAQMRNIDLFLEFKNISTAAIYFQGSGDQSGLAVRLNLERDDWTFSGGQGRVKPGSPPILSPWLDCSYRDDRHSTFSGVTIFQHSDNPGFTRPNWTISREGIVTAGVDSDGRFELKPGESLSFEFRILLHRGFGPSMNLMREYVKWVKPPLEPVEEPGLRLK